MTTCSICGRLSLNQNKALLNKGKVIDFNQTYGYGEALEALVGLRAINVRNLTQTEARLFDFDEQDIPALVLSNGTLLIASQDDEGNGPGRLILANWDNNNFEQNEGSLETLQELVGFDVKNFRDVSDTESRELGFNRAFGVPDLLVFSNGKLLVAAGRDGVERPGTIFLGKWSGQLDAPQA